MPDEPLPLDQPAEFTGEWWLPGNEAHKAFGRLTYSPDTRFELRLASGQHLMGMEAQIPWLHGLTVDGRFVTLRNCVAGPWRQSLPGGVEEVAYPEVAFVGLLAASDQELAMIDLKARMTNLNEWLGMSGYTVETFRGTPTGVKFSQPSAVALGRVEGALLSASFDARGSASPARTPFAISLEQHAWLRVQARRARRYDELRRGVDLFNGLLSLSAGVDCSMVELVGAARVEVREFGAERVSDRVAPVWVLFERVLSAAHVQRADRMLFTFDDSRTRKLVPIARWLRRSKTMEPVYNVYLSALPTQTLRLEYRFLAYVQALEAYHVRKHPQSMVLLNRLEALVDGLPSQIKKLVPGRFAELTKDTRVYFTHWNPQREAKAAKGDELLALTRGVKLLFELTMLGELGFPKRWIANQALSKNQRLVHAVETSFMSL